LGVGGMFDSSYFDNSKVLKFNTKISIKIEPNNYGTLFWAVIKFDKGYVQVNKQPIPVSRT
jgi:hypothetical protein